MNKHILHSLMKLSGEKIIFPFYHAVSDKDLPHIKHLYQVKKVEEFKTELDFICQNFSPITLPELIHFTKTNTQPKKPSFFLSFDDGLQESYTTIAPILKEKNIPAAFFINSDFLDNYNLMYRYKQSLIIEKMNELNINSVQNYTQSSILDLSYSDVSLIDELGLALGINFNTYLKETEPYMTSEQVLELKKQGFYIGSHSINHPYFHTISLKEQLHQTLHSLDFLVHKFDLTYKIFSFPFTDFGVTKEFYQRIKPHFNLIFSTAGIKKDEFNWNKKRFSMDKVDNIRLHILKKLCVYCIKKMLNYRAVHRHPST